MFELDSRADKERTNKARAEGGQALPAAQRRSAERALGTDLSAVRVLPNARNLGSSYAATYEDSIAFAPGKYRPGTLATDVVLAHELVHVAQQRAPSSQPVPARIAEAEADRGAAQIVSATLGLEVEPGRPSVSRGGLQLSRCDPAERPSTAGTGEHYDLMAGWNMSKPPTDVWRRVFGESFTVYASPDRADIQQHLTSLNQGGVYVFFGHGGQTAPGVTVGIMANDGVVRGQAIQDALAADGSPPTLVVLGGCATEDILQFVRDGGVPVAAGITENVSNLAGATAIGKFVDQLAGGQTFAEATTEANNVLSRANALLNAQGARLEVRYGPGYSSSMTLEEARAQHRTE